MIYLGFVIIVSLEVIEMEFPHVAGDVVLSECNELIMILELKAEGNKGKNEVEVNEVRIEVKLSANVRRVLNALALAE